MADRVTQFIEDRYEALSHCRLPVLCHNDFVDGNLLVQLTKEPQICGVFDLERADWVTR